MIDCCATCANLDKSKKTWDNLHYCYTYGCKADGRKQIVGWLLNDSELKSMGGSCYKAPEKIEQISLFDIGG